MRWRNTAGRSSWTRITKDTVPWFYACYWIHTGMSLRVESTHVRRDLMAAGKPDRGDSKLRIAIFISRTLWSWPTCVEEVVHSVHIDDYNSSLNVVARRYSDCTYVTGSTTIWIDVLRQSL